MGRAPVQAQRMLNVYFTTGNSIALSMPGA